MTTTTEKATARQKTPTTQPKAKTNGHTPDTYHVIPLADDQEPYQVRDIPLSQVVIPDGRREPKDVATLAASIQDIGLLHPITVVQENEDIYRLVSGRNRIAAYSLLRLTYIPAHIVHLDSLQAKLAEIDENLIRQELTELEYAEQLKRRKEIYERLHPNAKRGGAPGKAGGGKKTKSPASVHFVPSFLDDTVEKTGRGRSTIAQCVQIATNIDDDVKEQLRGTPIEDRKTDLLTLAKMPSDKQHATVNAIVSQEHSTVAEAIQMLEESGNPNFSKKPQKKKSLFDGDGHGLSVFLEDVKAYACNKMEKYTEIDILSCDEYTDNGNFFLVITLKGD